MGCVNALLWSARAPTTAREGACAPLSILQQTTMSKSDGIKIGAVLVQGGGIAGVQASLDLANSGFKVYLVERDAAIGGMMAHLDKTFPTGDCATCIVDRKSTRLNSSHLGISYAR